MATGKQVEEQLKQVGCNYTFWGSTETAQLCNLLMDNERIAVAVNGYYEGGFGLLVATNFRVLLVDKKPFVLNLEDLRYDMITEVTFGARLIIATVHISIPTRTIYFSSWSMDKLHKATKYIQQHVMDARNGGHTLPTDWFKQNLERPVAPQPLMSVSGVAKLARSALKGSGHGEEAVPLIGHQSANRAINPFAKIPSLERRRKYPAFYN